MPDVVVRCFPFWGTSRFRDVSLVLETGVFPLSAAELDRVDLLVEVLMVDNWRRITMRNEHGSPELKQPVNLSLRELGIGKRELGKFKACP